MCVAGEHPGVCALARVRVYTLCAHARTHVGLPFAHHRRRRSAHAPLGGYPLLLTPPETAHGRRCRTLNVALWLKKVAKCLEDWG